MKFCGRQRRRLKGSLFDAPQGDCRGNPAEQSGRHCYATGITHTGAYEAFRQYTNNK